MSYINNLQDPLVKAVILEDVVAVVGVIIAGLGISLANFTGHHAFDSAAR